MKRRCFIVNESMLILITNPIVDGDISISMLPNEHIIAK